MSEAVWLEVEGWSFAYPGSAVFERWSARVRPGVACVVGDEGTGKTTLLRLLAGDLVATAGQVRAGGQALTALQGQGGVFWSDPRDPALDPVIARDWLAGKAARFPAWDAGALQAHLAGFSLQAHLDKPLLALSTGSRRKLMLAAALASGAPLTLVDEPVSGLDQPSVRYLVQALSQRAGDADRVLLVAHYEALPGVPWDQVVGLR